MTQKQYIFIADHVLRSKQLIPMATKIEMQSKLKKELEEYCHSLVRAIRSDRLKHVNRFAGLEIVENNLLPEGEFIIK
jgi:hypothetical protein